MMGTEERSCSQRIAEQLDGRAEYVASLFAAAGGESVIDEETGADMGQERAVELLDEFPLDIERYTVIKVLLSNVTIHTHTAARYDHLVLAETFFHRLDREMRKAATERADSAEPTIKNPHDYDGTTRAELPPST